MTREGSTWRGGESEEEGADGGMQVITRAAAILGALAEPERRPQPRPARGADGSAQDHGAPHLHGARAGGLRAARTRRAAGRELGPSLLRLAAIGRRDLRAVLEPLIERLSVELNETVDLGVLDGDAGPVRRAAPGAAARPHGHRAGRRAVPRLHAWPAARCCWRSCRGGDPAAPAATARAHADGRQRTRESLLRELDEARATGLGFEREEMRHGICGVAVAVTDVDGRSASIAVPMPTARFEESEERVAALLLELKDRRPRPDSAAPEDVWTAPARRAPTLTRPAAGSPATQGAGGPSRRRRRSTPPSPPRLATFRRAPNYRLTNRRPAGRIVTASRNSHSTMRKSALSGQHPPTRPRSGGDQRNHKDTAEWTRESGGSNG